MADIALAAVTDAQSTVDEEGEYSMRSSGVWLENSF
jgi:hypothetical protein